MELDFISYRVISNLHNENENGKIEAAIFRTCRVTSCQLVVTDSLPGDCLHATLPAAPPSSSLCYATMNYLAAGWSVSLKGQLWFLRQNVKLKEHVKYLAIQNYCE